MNIVFDSYAPGREIPVQGFLKDRKLVKYLNREAKAAIVAVGKLAARAPIDAETPFYYATGLAEHEDYGLKEVVSGSRRSDGSFSFDRFVAEGMASVSPLKQFHILQNMPLSFVSITFGLRGDNGVVYSGAGALMRLAVSSPRPGPLLLGAGKTRKDGSVDCGFALVERDSPSISPWLGSEEEGIEIFRAWSGGAS